MSTLNTQIEARIQKADELDRVLHDAIEVPESAAGDEIVEQLMKSMRILSTNEARRREIAKMLV